jgi:hypothetical protein
VLKPRIIKYVTKYVTKWAFASSTFVGSSYTLAGLASYATTTPSPAISFDTTSLPSPFVDSSFILLPAASAKYALSTDSGATYTTYSTPNASTINGVAYGSGYYWITCGADVYKSTDCVNWTAVTMPSARDRYSIAILGNIIAIGSSNGVVTKSTDGGATWANITLPGYLFGGVGVRASATCIIAFPNSLGGTSPINLSRTTDGNTWTAITNPYNITSSGSAIAANSGNDWMIFSGNQAYIKSADDGLTWTKVTGSPNSRSIYSAWAADGYWAVGGSQGHINYSDDFGASWTEILPISSQITHIFAYKRRASLDPYAANVIALLHFDSDANGSNTITNSAQSGVTFTGSGGVISNANPLYGVHSAEVVNGSKSVNSSSGITLGSETAFTAELAWRWSGEHSSQQIRFNSVGRGLSPCVYKEATTNYLGIFDGATFHPSTYAMPVGTYVKIALVYNAGTMILFADGVEIKRVTGLAATIDLLLLGSGQFTIIPTRAHTGGFWAAGYVDEYRFTLGAARYTAAYTPPSAAFPNP